MKLPGGDPIDEEHIFRYLDGDVDSPHETLADELRAHGKKIVIGDIPPQKHLRDPHGAPTCQISFGIEWWLEDATPDEDPIEMRWSDEQ